MENRGSQQELEATEEIWISRATLRRIEAGNSANCVGCRQPITFSTKYRSSTQVIANVYDEGVWRRVETYHSECYEHRGEPYGPASEHPQMKVTVAAAVLAATLAETPNQSPAPSQLQPAEQAGQHRSI